jgi:hypothetical protein
MKMRQIIRIIEAASNPPTDPAVLYRLAEAPMTVIAFHGTRKRFGQFDPQFIGSASDRGYLGHGFYFSTTFHVAASYAYDHPDGAVLKCRLTLNNPYKLHVDNAIEYQTHFHQSDVRAWLEKYHYDSVICAHYPQDAEDDHSTEIMILHADQITILDRLEPDAKGVEGSGEDLRQHMEQHRGWHSG